MVPLTNSGQEQCSWWTTAFSQNILFEHAGLASEDSQGLQVLPQV